MTEQLTQDQNGAGTQAPAAPITTRVAWAPVARVNLLPMEIIESRRFRGTQGLLAGVVVIAVLAAAGGTVWAQRGVADADEQLVAAQAQVAAAQAEQARYATVPKVIAEVDAGLAARALAMSNDVLWSRYLNELDGARPAGVKLSGMSISLTGPVATAGADPLTPAGIGTITLDGTAAKYGQVASWLEALNKITGLGSSSLASAAQADGRVAFGSGATITADALSDRYQKKAG
jgi:hypothetical protein